MAYVSLHAHTSYSYLDSCLRIKDYVKKVKALGQNACAITDHGNISGALEFYKECKKQGIKPVIGCCLPGQIIYTKDGPKPIEKVTTDDYVITHNGRFKKVLRTMTRDYNGIIYGIDPWVNEKMWLTNEHPVLITYNTNETKWIRADEICFGQEKYKNGSPKKINNKLWKSYINIPTKYKFAKKDSFHMSEFLNITDKQYIIKSSKIAMRAWKKNGISDCKNSQSHWINTEFKLDYNFGRLCGLFLAEGSYYSINNKLTGISFTFNIDENEYVNFVLSMINKCFGVTGNAKKRKGKNTYDITISSTIIAELFYKLFGKYSYGKYINAKILYIDNNKFHRGILDGVCQGDAKTTKQFNVLKLSNKKLMYTLKHLFAKFGQTINILESHPKGKSCQKHVAFYAHISNKETKGKYSIVENDYIKCPIKNIDKKQYNGPVYNIEVEHDNSYLSSFAIHNCEFYCVEDNKDKERKSYHLIALAMNNKGWENIVKLTTYANTPLNKGGGFYYKPRIDLPTLFKHKEGVIILTACVGGLIPYHMVNDAQKAERLTKLFKKEFGDRFYLEIQQVNRDGIDYIPEQHTVIDVSRKFAAKYDIPVIATNDCFIPGTKISTIDGCRNIENLKIHDRVYTHNGELHNVEFINKRKIDENLVVIKPYLGSENIVCTKNHPILVKERKNKGINFKNKNIKIWKTAGEINENDILCIPKYKMIFPKRSDFSSSYDIWDNIEKKRGRILKNGYVKSYSQQHIKIPRNLKIDKTLCKILGMYMAEGNINNYKVSFTFNKKHNDFVNIVEKYFMQFGFNAYKTYHNEYIRIAYSSFVFRHIFKNFTGHLGHNKYIKNIHRFTESEIDTILKYYFYCDGHIRAQSFGICSCSEKLIYQISQYLNYKGYLSIPTKIKNKKHPSWKTQYFLNICGKQLLRFSKEFNSCEYDKNVKIQTTKNTKPKFCSDNNFFYTGIYKIYEKKYNGYVYNLQVENDNTYIANSYIVHNCHYLNKEDHVSHEILKAIYSRKTLDDPIKTESVPWGRMKFNGYDYYIQSEDEMLERFKKEEVEESQRIADRCNVEIEFKPASKIPNYNNFSDEEAYDLLLKKAREKTIKRKLFTKDDKDYVERVKKELTDIKEADLAHYFLIVNDVCEFADRKGIARGVGRGSAAGSLIAYILNITGVDPIKYSLIWERFYNKGRKGSYPDIDLDFDVERRGEIIDYLRQKFGHNKVYPMMTVGTMAGKAALKDVGRAINLQFDYINKITKKFPHKVDTIEKAIETSTDIKRFSEGIDEDIERWEKELKNSTNQLRKTQLKELINERSRKLKMLFKHAQTLEGCKRQPGGHACAIVVSDKDIGGEVPLSWDARNKRHVTAYDMRILESMGFLKLDVLGIKSMTVIDIIRKEMKKNGIVHNKKDSESYDDESVFNMASQGKTKGIFQLESHLGIAWMKKVKPSNIEQWSDVIALIRPATLDTGLAQQYVDNKNAQKIEYMHPDLEPIFSKTNGIMLFQEQLLKVARKIAGFSLIEADKLRKFVGKKLPEKMAQYKNKFIDGCIKNKYDKELADELWELIEAAASYSFNASHSTAYAMLGYTMAWYKKHYPLYFYLAMLRMAHQEQKPQQEIKELYYDAMKFGIKIKPPDINKSQFDFCIEDGVIYFGFKDLKGIGKSVKKAIERLKGVKCIHSLRHLIKQYKINQSTIKTLVFSGAFDETLLNHYDNRYEMWREFKIFYMLTDKRLEKIEEIMSNKKISFMAAVNEWAIEMGDKLKNDKLKKAVENNLSEIEKKKIIAEKEKEIIGFPITYSVADVYRKVDDGLSYAKFENGPILVCVEDFITIRSKKDNLLSMFDIYDSTDRQRAIYFHNNEEVHKKLKKALEHCDVCCIEGKLSAEYGSFCINKIYLPGKKSYVAVFDRDGIIKNISSNKLGTLVDIIYE